MVSLIVCFRVLLWLRKRKRIKFLFPSTPLWHISFRQLKWDTMTHILTPTAHFFFSLFCVAATTASMKKIRCFDSFVFHDQLCCCCSCRCRCCFFCVPVLFLHYSFFHLCLFRQHCELPIHRHTLFWHLCVVSPFLWETESVILNHVFGCAFWSVDHRLKKAHILHHVTVVVFSLIMILREHWNGGRVNISIWMYLNALPAITNVCSKQNSFLI